jgi:murein DD-endopeptidase MepM/ murein hydrolase activator NlpD
MNRLVSFVVVLGFFSNGCGGLQQRSNDSEVLGSNSAAVFIPPLSSYRVSSPFGQRSSGFHSGVDLAAPHSTAVKNIGNGVKQSSGTEGACGLVVRMSHSVSGKSWVSRYCHMSSFAGVNGRYYSQGTVIGRVGSTGRSSGPHLHLELYRNGVLQNPSGWIRL